MLYLYVGENPYGSHYGLRMHLSRQLRFDDSARGDQAAEVDVRFTGTLDMGAFSLEVNVRVTRVQAPKWDRTHPSLELEVELDRHKATLGYVSIDDYGRIEIYSTNQLRPLMPWLPEAIKLH